MVATESLSGRQPQTIPDYILAPARRGRLPVLRIKQAQNNPHLAGSRCDKKSILPDYAQSDATVNPPIVILSNPQRGAAYP